MQEKAEQQPRDPETGQFVSSGDDEDEGAESETESNESETASIESERAETPEASGMDQPDSAGAEEES